MAVYTVSLVWQYLFLIKRIEVCRSADRRCHQRPGFALTVVLEDPSVAFCIGDIKVVIAPPGGKHIVAPKQVHRLLGGRGTIQHKPHSEGSEDNRLPGTLMHRLAVDYEYCDGYPFFIHAIEADERGGQTCQLLFYAFFRHVCRNIVQCCIGHGFIAVFRSAADEHRRSIIPEIIIASHMHSAIPICKRECCTAELRSLNFHGEKGQGCLRNDIDHGLIVPDTVTDHVIKTVTVSDVHAIEIESVRISGQLLHAVQCLDTGEVRRRRKSPECSSGFLLFGIGRVVGFDPCQ